MITGELKNKVDKIWEIFWTGGITNPLEVIEQFNYLLFIKQLDEVETRKERDANILGIPYEGIFPADCQQYRWSKFKNLGDANEIYDLMMNGVFPFIKNLHPDGESAYSKYMGDAIFKIPTPALLTKVIDGIDGLNLQGDSKGDLYEYLLSKLESAGKNGQFRTPRHIIQMMVELVKPVPSDIICDPAMGSAGFLMAAQQYLRKNHKDLFLNAEQREHFNHEMFYGFDMDRTMLRIGAMNMLLHGVDDPNIEYKDSLSEMNTDKEKYSLILANPPFKGSLDYDGVSADLLKVAKTKKTELLFLVLFLRIMKIGGRAAVIVPDGVLFGSSRAHKAIRKELIENHKLDAVISMPSGVFKPYAGVSTAILLFTKTGAGGTDKVWFYDMKADGRTLDDKRQEIEENDIPDIIERYQNLEKEEERKRQEEAEKEANDKATSENLRKVLSEAVLVPTITRDTAIDTKVQEVLAQVVKPEMDNYDKLLACYKWIIDNSFYKYDGFTGSWNNTNVSYSNNRDRQVVSFAKTIICGVNGQRYGTCINYGSAMVVFARALGFEAYRVGGETLRADNSYGEHYWCVIKINGIWYNFDPQNADNNWTDPLRYFGKTNSEWLGIGYKFTHGSEKAEDYIKGGTYK